MSLSSESLEVLLVDPPGLQKSGYNLGLAYLAGALERRGVSVGIVDTNHCPDPERTCRDYVESCQPRIVGVSVKSATHASARRLASAIRALRPDITLVAGGPHVSLDPAGFVESAPEYDFAFAGEAEEGFSRFAAELVGRGTTSPPRLAVPGLSWRDGNGVHGSEPALVQDLDALSFPALQRFLNLDPRRLPYQLLTSRGCPYLCSYCCVGRISGRRWRARSVESVIAEVRHFQRQHGNPSFEIDDDNFTLRVPRAKQLCRELAAIPDLPPWCCPNGIRADRMDDELAELMRRANCDSVAFGVESAAERVLTANQKHESLAAIRRAAETCRATGIKTWGYFIIGLPESTFAADLESVRFGEEGPFDGRIYNLLVPYPGTPAWAWVERHGRFLRDYRNTLHFGGEAEPVFDTPDYTAAERILMHQITESSLHRLPGPAIEEMRRQVIREEPAICTLEADSYRPGAAARLLGRSPGARVRLADGEANTITFVRGEREQEIRLTGRSKLSTAVRLLRFLRRERIEVLLLPYTPLFSVLFLTSGCHLAIFYDDLATTTAATRLGAGLRFPAQLARALLQGGRPRIPAPASAPARRRVAERPTDSWRYVLDYLARIGTARLRRLIGGLAGPRASGLGHPPTGS